MTFTYVVSQNMGMVRLEIGDTHADDGPRPDSSNFSDEEINAILTAEGTVGRASARLLEILAAEWSAEAGRVSMADYSEDYTARAEKFEERARKLRRQHGAASRAALTQVAPTRVDGFSSDIDADDV